MSKKNLLLTIGTLCFFIIYMCGATTEPRKQTSNLIVTGHRGAAGLYPENTALSIKKALEFNVDRIEIDVHQTKDSIIILMHDKTIDRTTDGKGKIKNYTYKQLLEFNIEDSIKIPTLEEALKIVNNKAKLLIEIKYGNDYYPNIEKRILSVIENNKADNWCIVQSFEDDILKRIHKQNPNIPTHKLLLTGAFYDFEKLPFIMEYSVNYYFTTQNLVNKIHNLNKKINSWTVNSKNRIETLKKMGVDGVITDYPNLLLEKRLIKD